MKSNIFLYGPSGSGKSTIGKELANALNMDFLDLDAQVELDLGDSITNTIQNKGEEVFRDAETNALKNAVTASERSDRQGAQSKSGFTEPRPSTTGSTAIALRSGTGKVIALGGGALLRAQNQRIAEESGTIIFLEADVPTLVQRLSADTNKRPLLVGELEEKLTKLLNARAAHYSAFTNRVDASQPPEEIVWQIQRQLGRHHLTAMPPAYDVIAQEGALDQLGAHLKALELNDPLIVVSDSNVAPLYMERALAALQKVGYAAKQVVIPAGEEHKTLETISTLWDAFLAAGLDRKSTVIALGGGVVGDLAGFAAATFMRGCNWVAVPTTLLSMVDASMGGKTGFDLPTGKNLIGAFHPPRLVLADAKVLATLPERELRSGMAEVVKHGIIHDTELFELCKGLTTEHTKNTEKKPKKEKSHLSTSQKNSVNSVLSVVNLSQIVRLGMAVKIQIIEKDPFEQGIRAALNLGHTIGHAVELVSGFSILHGEAVGIGMVAEAKLAEGLGIAPSEIADEIAETLVTLGLPTEIPEHLPRPDLLAAIQHDKKKDKGVVKFALPVKIGEVKVGVVIENLAEMLEEVTSDE